MNKLSWFSAAVVLVLGLFPLSGLPSQPSAEVQMSSNPAPVAPTPAGPPQADFDADPGTPFTQAALQKWSGTPYKGADAALPIPLKQVANAAVARGLTAQQTAFLEQNGFAVLASGDLQFSDIREQVSDRYGQPYYLTSDAALHALHLNFDELLKALEREQLRPAMSGLVQAALDEVESYQVDAQGTSLEADAQLASAYLAVALQLFDPQAATDVALQAKVEAQVAQIKQAAGRGQSKLIPNFEDDYGAYKPTGHYAGDPDLEAYFRGMTWLGRTHFRLTDPSNPSFKPSRAPLIITLALRRAQVDDKPAAQTWSRIHEALSFIIGPSDDLGPPEYAALMDAVYGKNASHLSLLNDTSWKQFLERADELPAPKINSTFAVSTKEMGSERGWRMMGQRFTLDAHIIQNLLFDKVGSMDKRRLTPSGLDVMAALGSQPALQALEEAGETDYLNYTQQMTKMQQAVEAQSETEWLNNFYNGWLYAFDAQLSVKDERFPPAMRTDAWGYRDLNTALGSWAELKRDTTLYTKMPEPAAGGGPPTSGPAPAYVEPNPPVFYRLAYISHALRDGLIARGLSLDPMLVDPSESWGQFGGALTFQQLIDDMEDLSQHFQKLGDIAARELQGQPPTQDEWGLIQSCMGEVECTTLTAQRYGMDQELPPMPIVSAVSGSGDNEVLEAATGQLNRMYVIVPLEGKLQIAQGGIYSYYEFRQPRSARLTDEAWRQRLQSNPPALPAWTENFLLPGGKPADVLAFRVGDVYSITEAGKDLNLRQSPTTSAKVLRKLDQYEYVEIIGGPQSANGYTWWQVQVGIFGGEEETGWMVEEQTWYERAYGQ
jgi:hypothetical protein